MPSTLDSDEVMAELRRRRMSYRDISAACEVLLGWKLTEEHVRNRLQIDLGFPKLESHARYSDRGDTTER